MFLKYPAPHGMQIVWPLVWELYVWYSQLSVPSQCVDVVDVRLHSYQVRTTPMIRFALPVLSFDSSSFTYTHAHAYRYWMWFFNAWFWTLLAIQIQFGQGRHTTTSMVSSHLHFHIHNLLYNWLSDRTMGDDRWIVSIKGMCSLIDLMAFGLISIHS